MRKLLSALTIELYVSPLEEGDRWIEVIGTYVIPEFGSVVIIILVVAVSSAIIMSKSKFSVRYN